VEVREGCAEVAPKDAEGVAAEHVVAGFAQPVADYVIRGKFVNRPFRALIPGFFKPAMSKVAVSSGMRTP
jgi:hypothetical protein